MSSFDLIITLNETELFIFLPATSFLSPLSSFLFAKGSCDPECSEDGCEGPGPHQCISCLHYYLRFKNGTRCSSHFIQITDCPKVTLLNQTLRFMVKHDAKSLCRMCMSQCPQGFWGDRKRCKKCYSTCMTCAGSRGDQCSSCKPGYHLDQETKRCVTSCGDGYYLDHGK